MHITALHWVNAGLRRTWLVALATITVCTALAARAVTSFVDASYLDETSTRRPPLPHPVHESAPVPKATPDGSALVTRNMFCSACELEPGGPGPTDSYQPGAVLIATSIGRDPRATLRVTASEVQGSWGVGDVVPGVGRIERIGFSSIDVIEVAEPKRRGTLSLFDPLISGGRSDASAATPAPAAADPFADRVRKIDDRTFEVDRSLVRELVGGSVGAAGTRIAPVTKNGQLEGLRLVGVRSGSVASALGLRSGDVLQAVNNTKIESANTLLTMYSQLEQLSSVELAGTRGGKPLTLTLRLR